MKFHRTFFNIIKSFLPTQIFLCYCFIISGLIINCLQLLTSIFIWPFSKTFYRRINYYLATLLWSQITFLYSWWANSNVTVHVDPNDLRELQNEYSIILVNHRYEIDWLLGLVVAQNLNILGGLKIVGKKSLSLIPILGWSWFFTESIFLRRIWEEDRTILERDIQQLLNGYPENYYFNFLMACEGTRFTESKRIESMKYAREKNLPELKYHLLPRVKGFTMILQGAKGKIPAVYNFMLAFSKDSAPARFRTLLKGHSCKAQLYIKRYPIQDIPYDDENKCSDWLQRLFQEKDRIYDHFMQYDNFSDLGLPKVSVVRNKIDLLIEIFWLITIGIPSMIWFIQFLFNSTIFSKLILTIILITAYIILQLMINETVIKNPGTVNKNK